MTDTPRTKAELLALYADNTTGNISAQDLRDFVVTVMPDPVYMDILDSVTHQSFAAAETLYPVDYSSAGTVTDPRGLLGDAPYVSSYYSLTWPTGSWLLLPPGIYTYQIAVAFSVHIDPGLVNGLYMDFLVSYSIGVEAMIASSASSSSDDFSAHSRVANSGMLFVLQDEALPVGGVSQWDSANSYPLVATNAELTVTKVAEAVV